MCSPSSDRQCEDIRDSQYKDNICHCVEFVVVLDKIMYFLLLFCAMINSVISNVISRNCVGM